MNYLDLLNFMVKNYEDILEPKDDTSKEVWKLIKLVGISFFRIKKFKNGEEFVYFLDELSRIDTEFFKRNDIQITEKL